MDFTAIREGARRFLAQTEPKPAPVVGIEAATPAAEQHKFGDRIFADYRTRVVEKRAKQSEAERLSLAYFDANAVNDFAFVGEGNATITFDRGGEKLLRITLLGVGEFLVRPELSGIAGPLDAWFVPYVVKVLKIGDSFLLQSSSYATLRVSAKQLPELEAIFSKYVGELLDTYGPLTGA
jgi:hypothetical protein